MSTPFSLAHTLISQMQRAIRRAAAWVPDARHQQEYARETTTEEETTEEETEAEKEELPEVEIPPVVVAPIDDEEDEQPQDDRVPPPLVPQQPLVQDVPFV